MENVHPIFAVLFFMSLAVNAVLLVLLTGLKAPAKPLPAYKPVNLDDEIPF